MMSVNRTVNESVISISALTVESSAMNHAADQALFVRFTDIVAIFLGPIRR